MPRITNIKIRRGTSTEWTDANPILDSGEPGYDTEDNVLKIGDATKEWIDLPSVILSPNPQLAAGSTQYNLICLRSEIVNFKSVGDTNIFTVPVDHMFLIDKMEIVTTAISSADNSPSVRFGKSGSLDEFHESSPANTISLGERHIIESPQNGVAAGSIVTFGITEASTAASHYGCGIVTGYLLPVASSSMPTPTPTATPTPTPTPTATSGSPVYFKKNSPQELNVSW